MKRLGGRVTGIHVADPGERVLAATSQGFLLCYDLEGNLIWHRLFEQGLAHLTPMQEGVLVVDDAGGLRWVGLDGPVKELGSLPGPCSFTAKVGDTVCLTSGSEVFSYTSKMA